MTRNGERFLNDLVAQVREAMPDELENVSDHRLKRIAEEAIADLVMEEAYAKMLADLTTEVVKLARLQLQHG